MGGATVSRETVGLGPVKGHKAKVLPLGDDRRTLEAVAAGVPGHTRYYLACSCGYCGRLRWTPGMAGLDMEAHLRAARAKAAG